MIKVRRHPGAGRRRPRLARPLTAVTTRAPLPGPPAPGGFGASSLKCRPTIRITKHTPAAPSATGAPSTWFTPLLSATTASAAPTRAGIAYSPLLNTLGTCRISTSRTVPPPTPVTVPRMIACTGPTPISSALPAPVTANRLSPAASSTSIGLVNRLSQPAEQERDQPPAGRHGQVTPVEHLRRVTRATLALPTRNIVVTLYRWTTWRRRSPTRCGERSW